MPSPSAAPSLLRHKPFLSFVTSNALTTIAYQMQVLAVGWTVYDLTHDPLDLGFVGLAQFLPALALALVVGHVADRYDRLVIVRLCQIAEALSVFFLAFGVFGHWLTPPIVFATVVVVGIARAFESPTLQAVLPGLVPAELLPRAISANSAAKQAAIIAGPALGGLLYAIGPLYVFALSGIGSLLALGGLLTVRLERAVARREPATLKSVLAGIAFIRQRPVILGSISLDLFAVLLGGATSLLPVYARDILDIGPLGLGTLRSAQAVGSLAMMLFITRHPLKRHVGRTMFAAVAVFGLATIGFGLSRWFPLSLLMLAILGASDSISVVVRSSLVQLQTPDEMRGRVSAVNSIFIGTSNQLGEFESGVTAAWWGAVPAVVVGGLGTLVVVAVWMKLFPPLLNADRLILEENAGTRVAVERAKSDAAEQANA